MRAGPISRPELLLLAGLALGGCERERPTFRADLPPCPARMVQLGRACIDRHEALIASGRAEPALEAPPAVGVAYAEADRACREAGYRL